MANPGEVAGMIMALPTARPVKLNVQSLLAEADAMKDIVLPMLVETGNMNPGRWEKMAGIYHELGMVSSTGRLKGFVYETDPDKQTSKQWVKFLAFASGLILLLAIISPAWVRMLRSQVKARTKELVDVSTLQHAILENASYAIISTNLDGSITSFNLAAEKLLGYSAEEVIGKQTPALFHLQEEVAVRGEELARIYKEPIEGFEVFVTPARRNVELTLSDTGTGMTKDVIEHIFEPFYTTKGHGKGTGLGLATVYGTIKNHQGAININSEPGMGTVFKVYLPTCCEVPHTADVFESVSGSGSILIVDDEAILRSVAQDLLENLGYTVFVAENGNQALEIYAMESSQIKLVLLDMIMPGLNGKETLLRLRELNPEVKVLFCSGFHNEGTNEQSHC